MKRLALLKELLAKNSGKVPLDSTAKTAKSPDSGAAAPHDPAGDPAIVAENSEKHVIDSTAKTVKSPFLQFLQDPSEHVFPKLQPNERRCYQCASFQRSPYGFPLGLCRQHDNRIQHSTSQPASFGCGGFMLRNPADNARTCLACRHYSQLSTMCDEVHTGCPCPAIPPCSGGKFQQGECRP